MIRMGNYRHFKGNVYFVIGEATHSETEETLVIYKSNNGKFWVRPKDSFISNVVLKSGKVVPRFKYVGGGF